MNYLVGHTLWTVNDVPWRNPLERPLSVFMASEGSFQVKGPWKQQRPLGGTSMTVHSVHDIITQSDIINAAFFDLQLMTDVGIPKEFAEECSRHESNKLLYITSYNVHRRG